MVTLKDEFIEINHPFHIEMNKTQIIGVGKSNDFYSTHCDVKLVRKTEYSCTIIIFE